MTHLRQYVDLVLGGELDAVVRTYRKQGHGWEHIAKELWRMTNHKVNLSGQTLRGWYTPRKQSA